ncbi:MAG: c-type cytochrome [Acidobacteria bacterium]|nr:c-type cytochrome [Acidobacteriota bacterium]
MQNCAACHGDAGRGDGPAATFLFPKPRDFTKGIYKIRTTATGELPTRQDLFDTLRRGIPGTAMPSFSYLTDSERWALVDYAISLVPAEFRATKPPVISAGVEPPSTAERLLLGRRVYEDDQKGGCAKCHGVSGRGDGPSAKTLRDEWGYPTFPADLTSGGFKGGSSARDVFLRLTTGMGGTPMPSYEELLTEEERWDVTHYVESLVRPDRPQIPSQVSNLTLTAYRKDQPLAANPYDPVWEKMGGVSIPLMRLWKGEGAPGLLKVSAVHNGKEIAFLLEWNDSKVDGLMLRPQDYPDAAAVMFPLTKPPGHFTMGSKGKPVNIWQWRSDRQMDLEKFQDVDDLYPGMVVDDYPLDSAYYPKRKEVGHRALSSASTQDAAFLTGHGAGNPMSGIKRTSAVEDLVAEGFGTLTPRPSEEQNVKGRGAWESGSWKVVLVRSLARGNSKGDVVLTPGDRTNVAFAVWDGGAGDRDGQKSVTYWQILELEK